MRFTIRRPKWQNIVTLMRRVGYIPWRNSRTGEKTFIRKLGTSFYPRFHLQAYFDKERNLVCDLHLDWRRPMHRPAIKSYESEESGVVKDEAERIKKLFISLDR